METAFIEWRLMVAFLQGPRGGYETTSKERIDDHA